MSRPPVFMVGLDNDLVYSLRMDGFELIGYSALSDAGIGVPYFGNDEAARLRLPKAARLLIPIDNAAARAKLMAFYKDFQFMSYISSRSEISDRAKLGANLIVQRGTFISDNVVIEDNVKINCNVALHHDCRIGQFTTISPSCVLLGNVSVGKNCYVGAGTTIRNRFSVGEDTTIGMGSNVISDIPARSIAFGNPCRVQKPIS